MPLKEYHQHMRDDARNFHENDRFSSSVPTLKEMSGARLAGDEHNQVPASYRTPCRPACRSQPQVGTAAAPLPRVALVTNIDGPMPHHRAVPDWLKAMRLDAGMQPAILQGTQVRLSMAVHQGAHLLKPTSVFPAIRLRIAELYLPDVAVPITQQLPEAFSVLPSCAALRNSAFLARQGNRSIHAE